MLVVEDHVRVARGVQRALAAEGFDVTVTGSGTDGLARACSAAYDVVVLDVMLPGPTGFEILEAVRQRGIQTLVLVLTARDALDDRLTGFAAGADDYLVKPFAIPELVARIRALLTRTRTVARTSLVVADLELDLISRRCSRGGVAIDLAPREFELLAYLMSHAGQIVTREMLGQHVWNALARGTPLHNVVDVHIGRLRRKIDGDGRSRLVETIRGFGFRIAMPTD